MTWNLHIPVTAEKKHAARLDTGVKIGVNVFGRNSKTYRTLISLSTDVVERVFKVKDQQAFNVRIYMGDGEDKGKLRLVMCKLVDDGSVRVTFNKAGKKGWYKVQMGEVPVFPQWAQSMKMCNIVPEDGALTLTLPEWAPAPHLKREVRHSPQMGTGTKPLPMAAKPAYPVANPVMPERKIDAAAEKAKALIPAPNFSGVQKPKLSRAEAMAAIGKL